LSERSESQILLQFASGENVFTPEPVPKCFFEKLTWLRGRAKRARNLFLWQKNRLQVLPWQKHFTAPAQRQDNMVDRLSAKGETTCSVNKPFRQLFGYAISAKRYALYSKSGENIQIEKASGHGLGYLLAPNERQKDEEEETPQWVMETWNFLLRKEFKLRPEEPPWLDLPAMMRMVVTTPNVFKQQRPEWLGPFNFFLFPLLSELGGYPSGFSKSNFLFITPYESDRGEWESLEGINLFDGQSYQIAHRQTIRQDKVVPDSFRIVLNQYLKKPEVKSLSPDGTPCTGATQGLLRRANIVAGNLIPVGKKTDRRWEQGEDPSMLDFGIQVYEKQRKMVVADASERKEWSLIGLRRLMRESKLSQDPVSKAIKGKPVRRQTLSIIRQAAARITA